MITCRGPKGKIIAFIRSVGKGTMSYAATASNLNFIESFKSEPRHQSDFHEGTPRYNNNNNVIINILDQIYASFKKLW